MGIFDDCYTGVANNGECSTGAAYFLAIAMPVQRIITLCSTGVAYFSDICCTGTAISQCYAGVAN
jgi:hypothetical protein